MTEPRPVTDLSPATWVVEQTEDAALYAVAGHLPSGFETYARVLHPVAVGDGDEGRAVTWAEVAQIHGRRMHPLVQFDALVGIDRDQQDDYGCAIGAMPGEISGAFCEVLARHTGAPDECWFGVWDGWGWVEGGSAVGSLTFSDGEERITTPDLRPSPPGYPREVVDGGRVSVGDRDFVLLRGPLAGIGLIGWRSSDDRFWPQWPSLFWPDDRAWCVATDVDLDSTYVGGSERLIGDLLADPRLETWPTHLEDRVDVGADHVNPPPWRHD